jgi:hypothetical protein
VAPRPEVIKKFVLFLFQEYGYEMGCGTMEWGYQYSMGWNLRVLHDTYIIIYHITACLVSVFGKTKNKNKT